MAKPGIATWSGVDLKLGEEAQPPLAALDQFDRKAVKVTDTPALVNAFAEFLHTARVGVEEGALNEGERGGLVRAFASALAREPSVATEPR